MLFTTSMMRLRLATSKCQLGLFPRLALMVAKSGVFPKATTTTTLPRSQTGQQLRSYSDSTLSLSSPFDSSTRNSLPKGGRRKKIFVPRKAAVTLTEPARQLFLKLLESKPDKDGIMLDYHQSSSGQPRMVFSFRFVSKEDLLEQDEGVTLEVDSDGKPKTPTETLGDGKQKLYIHHNAFLKVLGATVDFDPETLTPILYDREGNEMDPNV